LKVRTARKEARLVRPSAERLKLALDLGERARKLLPSCGVCRGFELPAELGVSQTKRFGSPQLFGIAIALRHCPPRPLFFPLVHPFLYAVLCVDESFACVCHLHLLVYPSAPLKRTLSLSKGVVRFYQ
jgi:hypothetical protein